MELNLKILAPLLQCTSIDRCVLFIKVKKKKLFYSSQPIKKLLNFLFHPVPLSLSLTVDRLTVLSRRSPHCPKLPIADCLTVPSCRSSHRHSPLCRPSSLTRPFCWPSSSTLILFVIGDCWFCLVWVEEKNWRFGFFFFSLLWIGGGGGGGVGVGGGCGYSCSRG